MYAVPLIKKFAVEKDTNNPTHSVVKVHISRRAAQEPRTILRTLPSLKKTVSAKGGQDDGEHGMETKAGEARRGEAKATRSHG